MNYITIIINTIIHIILVLLFEGVFLFGILYPILKRKVKHITDKFTYDFYINKIMPSINWSKCSTPDNKPKDLTPYYITPELYNLIQISETTEKQKLNSNINYPYIVYAIIISILFVLVVSIIFITRYMNIYVNYKYIFINSFIIFLLICGIASSILWFDVFSQDYNINIIKPFLIKFLEEYKSL
jgi:hypothetical protein